MLEIIKTVYDNALISAAISTFVALASSGLFSFLRRPKETSQGEAKYLTDQKLLSPPTERPAYSDRMAYILAELSALAYFEFERPTGNIREASKKLADMVSAKEGELFEWLNKFANNLLFKGMDSEEFLEKVLNSAGFELLGTINIDETQGFICKKQSNVESKSYVVVAFRGTEKKVKDWLTDAKAVPTIREDQKVHTGFIEALTRSTDGDGKTVLASLNEVLESSDVLDNDGNKLPLFFTGHSLGGALALLSTKEIELNVAAACYTYGAPRVANYEYFDGLKTPVYRVVNSADIVPRVPPGAVIGVIIKAINGLSWLSALIPFLSNLFKKLESFVDKLNGYRHYGDLRYLTDVSSGRFEDVRLLSNPPMIDRVIWMGEQLRASLLIPIKSHGMDIYRKKLSHIANVRNQNSNMHP